MFLKNKITIILACWLLCVGFLHGQPTALFVQSSFQKYKATVALLPDSRMVELKQLNPTFVYDLRYASLNNFVHRYMYPKNTASTFLRKPAAEALSNAQKEINKEGLGIKIFDAYRPYSVSKKFWELIKDERYVAPPTKGSNHNRGTAVDITLIDLSTGRELDMGTEFDNFSDTAHHSFKRLPPNVLSNRQRLIALMNKYGFAELETEWWHYTFKTSIKFDVLDIPFYKLNLISKESKLQ